VNNSVSYDAGLVQPQAALATRKEWIAFMAITIGSFVAMLDVQIVASSLNQIQAGLSASVDEIQWVQTSYLIAEIVAVPLAGFLGPLLSTGVLYTVSCIGFTVSSVACAFAWNLPSMVVFRALQGFLGGGMLPASYAAMFMLFPDQKQLRLAQMLGGMTSTLAPAIGPTFGGYITESMSWHWLFLINFVPGFACAALVWKYLHVDKPRPELLKGFDRWSVVAMALFLGCLEYVLDDGPRHDWFDNRSIAACAAIAAVSGVIFFWRNFTVPGSVVDLRIFRDRNFTLTSIISALLGVSLFTLIYITPVFLGEVRGFNSEQIGQVMMVQGLALLLSAPLAAWISSSMDPRLTIFSGLALYALGSYLNAALTADWGFSEFVIPQLLRGAGLMISFIPMMNLALGFLPPADLNNASALFTVVRNLGGALGLAAVTTLMNHRTWTHWQSLAESTALSRPAVRDALDGMQSALVSSMGNNAYLGAVSELFVQAQRQAMAMTFSDMYFLLSICSALPLLVVPFIRKPERDVGMAGH
jgi:DHA2 family multidrug resistance protein